MIVVSIDTLRTDHLPAYGYSGVETPAIDRLRQDAILYRNAFSHVPLTLPSHTSMFSGRLPSEHGVRDNVGYPVPATPRALAALAAEDRAATPPAARSRASSCAAKPASRAASTSSTAGSSGARRRPLGSVTRSGADTLLAARDWLDALEGRAVLLLPPPLRAAHAVHPAATVRRQLQASPVRRRDRRGRPRGRTLVRPSSAELGVYDRALVVLLSDHGEGLGRSRRTRTRRCCSIAKRSRCRCW